MEPTVFHEDRPSALNTAARARGKEPTMDALEPDSAWMAGLLKGLHIRKAPPAKRCKCGSPLGLGEHCTRCAAQRVRQNQPDERTRKALAHKNRALW